jgi:hypothetical protein
MDGKLSGSFQSSSGGGGGTVTAVTATAPLASSGGATPNITLTGTPVGGVNSQVANYNVVAGDAGKIIDVNAAGAVTIGLPSPPPSATFAIFVQSLGAGLTTITPAGGLTIDGNANVTLAAGANQGVYVSTDGVNYFTARGKVIPATTTRLGSVIPDGVTIDVAVGGGISVPTATNAALGLVQPDGTIITVIAGAITVPKATNAAFGVVEVDGTTITAAGGVISAAGGGAVPGMVQIAQQVLAGAVPTVTFSAIPGTYTSLKLIITCRSAAVAQDDNLALIANADAGANYSNQNMNGVHNGLTTGGHQLVVPATAIIGSCPAASAPAGCAGTTICDFPGYAGTTFFKGAVSSNGGRDNTPQCYFISAFWEWANTAAITSIEIETTSGSNFLVGSTFTLYGLR